MESQVPTGAGNSNMHKPLAERNRSFNKPSFVTGECRACTFGTLCIWEYMYTLSFLNGITTLQGLIQLIIG